ncbi:arginine decarboxylase [Thalassoporum mexicanum PCC 7367]|uniref:aminotransferase class I/II-fold pyridoxal phosphate-dependent enzyme n=1 Tax=Thalassoporum mexicanum TaxID=3457544 RepID=UPI00029F8EB5|nr:aminotransferase class I/II-fold pyridoxal phosphate-dependent enzyme [Pseudanabaena sp. PCC 7367]AFY69655.1 arginine decarboxylase [Pseudanabaena sp. PCC 7367]
MEQLDQSQAPILNALQSYLAIDQAAFYMPGHKRGNCIDPQLDELLGSNIFKLDLPELPGLEDTIAQAETLAAAAYGAKQTRFLVNGSTIGVQAIVLATCQPGDKILVGRNCHRSVISALILSGARPIYLPTSYNTEFDLDLGVSIHTLKQALAKHSDARAILITSPNYFGVGAELKEMVAIAHAHHLPVLVDEAHGAHLHFHPDLPIDAIAAGADLVVQSTHKMATSLTQSSILHCGNSLNEYGLELEAIDAAINLLQSTSPSILLLASLDAARRQMATTGHKLLDRTIELANQARSQIDHILNLRTIPASITANFDPTRLTVMLDRLALTGFDADQILLDSLDAVAEMPTLSQLVFAFSIGNRNDDVDKLVRSLQVLSDQYSQSRSMDQSALESKQDLMIQILTKLPRSPLTPREAFFAKSKRVRLNTAIGKISTELAYAYPPGIPILCPGEEITKAAIEFLRLLKSSGGVINGCSDPELEMIMVIA